jgi:hypothetical protein
LRAVAGLYLALAAFWLYAAFNDKYIDTALLTAILFAGGLAARCDTLPTSVGYLDVVSSVHVRFQGGITNIAI